MAVDVLAEAAEAGRRGEAAALVTVIEVAGSTPRHPGARMLVRAGAGGEDGAVGLVGTIGGGKIEHEVIALAARVARGEAAAQRFERHLTHDLAMCCGGRMTLWIEPLGGARWKALAEAARRRRARRPCLLATLMHGPGDGGMDVLAWPAERPPTARRAALDGAERFVEPLRPASRLVVFGAGHVAQALAPIAASVGFELVVCDESEAFASAERFPGARLLASFDAREVAGELGGLDEDDHVVIMTRDHAIDQALVEQLIGAPRLGYLGLIGSRGKVGRFQKRLEARGVAPAAAWARVHAPVGLDLGAETPEEIAVAIVAELVRHRHRGPAARDAGR